MEHKTDFASPEVELGTYGVADNVEILDEEDAQVQIVIDQLDYPDYTPKGKSDASQPPSDVVQ
jgi:hypothetical protein